jgi:hypothetical protein
MRVFWGVVMGIVLGGVGLGMLRSLRNTPGHVPFEEPEAAPSNVRITFRCETCHTEVLLLRKGSESAPRHCGEKMLRREEVPRDS